jgi:6-phosphogluconolactonase/glucosamine-6-phosphate isomerase/deaminase
MDIVIAPDAQTAGDEAAAWLARQMRNAVTRRGAATVALSGGSTPKLMLGALAGMAVCVAGVFLVNWRIDGKNAR